MRYEPNTPEMTHEFITHIEIGALDRLLWVVVRTAYWQEYGIPVDTMGIHVDYRGSKGVRRRRGQQLREFKRPKCGRTETKASECGRNCD